MSHFLYVESKNTRSLNFRVGQFAPQGHALLCSVNLAISASECPRYLNMGCKMTAIIEFMGTQGNFEALQPFVFA